ncbi:MAG: hypothetical protein JNM90_09490 [Burkholderiales bacterium]|nr:hypothetical protein [Burkholderiales bacterium]
MKLFYLLEGSKMEARNDMQAVMGRILRSATQPVPGVGPSMREERMPFRIRIVKDEADLARAVSIRHAAYARHVPTFAASLMHPESFDFEDGTVILLAESKLDGSPIGTMRIKTNRHSPLGLEQSVKLPDWLEFTSIAEATRLGIATGRMGMVVKTMLFKAFYQYCRQAGIEWMVITARAPLDRQYEDLLFDDVYPDGGFIPMKHIGGIPHRVMALDVVNAQAKWSEARHPLLGFMCETHHPDIDVSVPADALPRLPAPPAVQPAVVLM